MVVPCCRWKLMYSCTSLHMMGLVPTTAMILSTGNSRGAGAAPCWPKAGRVTTLISARRESVRKITYGFLTGAAGLGAGTGGAAWAGGPPGIGTAEGGVDA